MMKIDTNALEAITGGAGGSAWKTFDGPSGHAYMDEHGRLRVRMTTPAGRVERVFWERLPTPYPADGAPVRSGPPNKWHLFGK